jgi:SAM-dependent MidA family methyltransferase
VQQSAVVQEMGWEAQNPKHSALNQTNSNTMLNEEIIKQVLTKRFGETDYTYTVSYSYLKKLFKQLMLEVLDHARLSRNPSRNKGDQNERDQDSEK